MSEYLDELHQQETQAWRNLVGLRNYEKERLTKLVKQLDNSLTDILDIVSTYDNEETCPACGEEYVLGIHKRGYKISVCPSKDCKINTALSLVEYVQKEFKSND